MKLLRLPRAVVRFLRRSLGLGPLQVEVGHGWMRVGNLYTLPLAGMDKCRQEAFLAGFKEDSARLGVDVEFVRKGRP